MRAWLAVAAGYVVVRVLLVLSVAPKTDHPDTDDYFEGISLLGRAPRGWVVPLLFAIDNARAVTVVQAIVSAVAFVALAAALSSQFNDQRVRWAAGAIVLLIGLAPRVTVWDGVLLSESLAISFTALLIAAGIWIDRLPAGAVVAVFVVWVFTRDAHVYLGVFVLAAVTVWGWRRRKWALPVGIALVLAWSAVANGNDRYVESINVTVNIAFHHADDPDAMAWFHERGMPRSAALELEAFPDRWRAMWADEAFQKWASGDGLNVYARYLATHPGFTLPPLRYLVIDEQGVESLTDHTYMPFDHPPGVDLVWPRESVPFVPVLAAVAGLSVMAARWRRRWLRRRAGIPLLIVATIPAHTLLAYHATPFEVGRHGVILAFTAVLAGWWIVGLAVDSIVSGDRDAVAVGDPSLPVGPVGMVAGVGGSDDAEQFDVSVLQ